MWVIVSQGRRCETCTSEWHWLQEILEWREPSTSVAFTSHRAAIPGLEVLIGVAAHAVRVGHAIVVKDVANLVRLVAIDAGREHVRFFLPQFAADRLPVHGFNLRVALGAGRGDVAPEIDELGSVWGRMLCAVWQEAQVADTVSPFLSTPSP